MVESSERPGAVSSWRCRGLVARLVLSLGFVLAMFLSLGGAGLMPATSTPVATYNTCAAWSTWTFTGAVGVVGSCSGAGGIFGNGGSGSATSPAVALASTGVSVSFVTTDNCSNETLALLVDGVSHPLTLSGSGPCSSSVYVPDSYTHTYKVVLTTINNVTLSDAVLSSAGTPAGPSGANGLSFPLLDLGSISSQMGAYFGFIAPGLWVIAGIGLGGMIVGRVRGLF